MYTAVTHIIICSKRPDVYYAKFTANTLIQWVVFNTRVVALLDEAEELTSSALSYMVFDRTMVSHILISENWRYFCRMSYYC